MSDPKFLPYGRQSIDDDDVAAVVAVLRGDWLTTGPKVAEFEQKFAEFCGAKHAVAVSSGTAALHCLYHAAGIGEGDEIIVPALTFAATANAALYCGATPVFADVEADTLLIDPASVAQKITAKTKAIVAVDYAGQPANYQALHKLAEEHGLHLLADACHALGGEYHGQSVGSLADASTFSLHPVKPMTTGEGGMIVTDNAQWAHAMRIFRNHGITSDHRAREQAGSWSYEMTELGYNYRLSDINCALGISQMPKVADWTRQRQQIAHWYDEALAGSNHAAPLVTRPNVSHAHHLYVVRVPDRAAAFAHLREQKIGVNVHYLPVYRHPYYRELGYNAGECPVAEAAYEQILSLPIFPAMEESDVTRVVESLHLVIERENTKAL